eukprot:jgi/Botrbrau1/21538/Bobra.174_2s0041.1
MQLWEQRARRKVPSSMETARDQERLVNKVVFLDLDARREPSKGSGDGEAVGKWYEAAFHTVTAIVGVGVLGLPYAFSYLLWYGGIAAIILSAVVSLYTAYLLAALHEDSFGHRYSRYRDLGVAILGKRLGLWVVVPFQFSVMIGLAITYTVTAGESLLAVSSSQCGTSAGEGASGGVLAPPCLFQLRMWIVFFGLCQLVLSQMKDFHSLWGLSLLGAVMSAMYSTIAFGASLAVAGTHDAEYRLREESPADLVFGAFNALGSIMFAYGGHAVLLEIQATLAPTPSPLQAMMRGLGAAYAVVIGTYFPVAVAGYAAFGRDVRSDVLLSVQDPSWLVTAANIMVVLHVAASFQVFSQPVFEAVEGGLAANGMLTPSCLPLSRLIVRCTYVAVVTAVAAFLPFFANLMGLIGAVGFTPMTFIVPCILWIKATKPVGIELWWNRSIIAVFGTMGILAFIGSVRNLSLSLLAVSPT